MRKSINFHVIEEVVLSLYSVLELHGRVKKVLLDECNEPLLIGLGRNRRNIFKPLSSLNTLEYPLASLAHTPVLQVVNYAKVVNLDLLVIPKTGWNSKKWRFDLPDLLCL